MGDADKPAACPQVSVKEEDLDSLLDSALDDFEKPLPSPAVGALSPQQQPSTSGGSEAADGGTKKSAAEDAATNQWASEFKNFQDVMQSLMNADPNSLGDLGLGGSSDEFALSFAETLKAITECTQSMPEPTPEELAQLLNSMGVDDSGGANGDEAIPDVVPLMQNVMQSLLSKELLYPALKDFVAKYPDWLASKRESLPKEEFEKYSTQYDLMKQVCEEFEREFPDTEEEKAKSFQKILLLMQKMKDCGDPPKELVGDISPELAALEQQGGLPGKLEQCAIM